MEHPTTFDPYRFWKNTKSPTQNIPKQDSAVARSTARWKLNPKLAKKILAVVLQISIALLLTSFGIKGLIDSSYNDGLLRGLPDSKYFYHTVLGGSWDELDLNHKEFSKIVIESEMHRDPAVAFVVMALHSQTSKIIVIPAKSPLNSSLDARVFRQKSNDKQASLFGKITDWQQTSEFNQLLTWVNAVAKSQILKKKKFFADPKLITY
jgi:hypothetical protein